MSRKSLINRLMTIDLNAVLDILPTKGELNRMSDSDLAFLLTSYDTVKNIQYKAQSIVIRCPREVAV